MKGRFYGGGMMAAPEQDRKDPTGNLSVMLFHGKGRLQTLMAFPSIFKGEHIKKTNMVTVLTGNDITVSFDTPAAVQIDGETILDVSSYHATAKTKRT
jgi:diacylglycerol kinase family enzyme